MKKTIIIVAIICIGLLIIGCTANSSKPKMANQPKKEAHKVESKSKKEDNIYSGIVFEVNPESKIVKVRQEDSDLAMTFDVSNTKLAGYKDTEDIKNGDKVAVGYRVERGSTIALTISKK